MSQFEMVHIEVQWYDIGKPLPEPQADSEKDCLWFMVDGSKIIPVVHPRYVHNQDVLFGSIKFTPMQTDGEFYITPYKNNIDVELDMVGLDEAFGAGNDVEVLGAIALERKSAEYAGVESWYFTAIALYRVGVYTTHTEWGNDSETEYELLGILDTSKLPLALATKPDEDEDVLSLQRATRALEASRQPEDEKYESDSDRYNPYGLDMDDNWRMGL